MVPEVERALELADGLVPESRAPTRVLRVLRLQRAHDGHLLAQRAPHGFRAPAGEARDARHGDPHGAELGAAVEIDAVTELVAARR